MKTLKRLHFDCCIISKCEKVHGVGGALPGRVHVRGGHLSVGSEPQDYRISELGRRQHPPARAWALKLKHVNQWGADARGSTQTRTM